MGTGVIEFGDDDDDEQNEPCCSAASSAVFPSIHPQNRPKKPPKMSVKKEVLELERMERPKRRSVVLAEKLIAKCNEEVQFLYDSKADPSFRCSSAARFRKPKKEEADPDFREGLEPRASTSDGTHTGEKTPLSTLEGQVKRSSREAMCVLDELRRSKESRRRTPGTSVRAQPPTLPSEPSACVPLARRTCYASRTKLVRGSSRHTPTAKRTRPKQAARNEMDPSLN